jgi:hypothetical protein
MVNSRVSIALGVSGGAAVLALLVIVLVLFVPRRAVSPQTKCGDAPTVDTTTGAVTNYTHALMPDLLTCGENVGALSSLCLTQQCLSDECVKTGAFLTWDAYDTEKKACVKVSDPTCEQQLCDAPYCTSPSVRATLPPFHQITGSNGQCFNPSPLDVAAQCNALPDSQFVSPDCRSVTLRPTMRASVTTEFTTRVEGVLTLPPDSTPTSWRFSYNLEGVSGVFTGPIATSPALDDMCKQDEGAMCLAFHIYFPPRTVLPGNYTLQLFARPSWSEVNTVTLAKPLTVKLVDDTSTDPNKQDALTVRPSRDDAKALASTKLAELLVNLPAVVPGACVSPTLSLNDLIVLPPTGSTGAGSSEALLLACTPNVCPFAGSGMKLMKYAIVVVAWPVVEPVTGCDGVVTYSVNKDQGRGVLSPVTVIPGATHVAFTDVLAVGETASYTIVATQGACFGDTYAFTLSVPAFTDEDVCHKVAADQQTCKPLLDPLAASNPSRPPWMWSSPSGCEWRPRDSTASDVYCALESTGKFTPLNSQQLTLADSTGECHALQPSTAVVTQPFPGPYCDDESQKSAVCFTGLQTGVPRTATCSDALRLGDTAERITGAQTFVTRMASLVDFLNRHSMTDSANVAALNDPVGVYSSYLRCGPALDAERWGVTGCDANDAACVAAAANAACGTGDADRNYCDPWVLTGKDGLSKTYSQERTCFGSPSFTAGTCCPVGKQYTFDNMQAKGGTRGYCA